MPVSSFSVQCEMDSQRARRSRGGYIIPGALGRQFTGGFFRQGGSVERGGGVGRAGSTRFAAPCHCVAESRAGSRRVVYLMEVAEKGGKGIIYVQ